MNPRPRSLFTAILGLMILAVAANARAAETLAGPVPARVMHVIDGDTLVVRARIWLGQEVETAVRLAGVDAPELKGACTSERERAQLAREYLSSRVLGGAVMLTGVRYEKYGGRILAQVRLEDGRDLAQLLLAEGHARAYDGRARARWCEEARSAD